MVPMKDSASLMKTSLRNSGLVVQRAGLGPRYHPTIRPPRDPHGWPNSDSHRSIVPRSSPAIWGTKFDAK